jgi:BMFP domain-containing protein YqiC
MDGENYNIGLVDVTDRPYAELRDAAVATHKRLFEVHSGTTPPVSRRPMASDVGAPSSPWDIDVTLDPSSTAPQPSPRRMTDMLLVLIETRNEVAQNALNDKNYKQAFETALTTLALVREENAPEDHKIVVATRKILDEARARLGPTEATACEAEAAFRANDLVTAAEKLQKLIELDPQHPVVKRLKPKLEARTPDK